MFVKNEYFIGYAQFFEYFYSIQGDKWNLMDGM